MCIRDRLYQSLVDTAPDSPLGELAKKSLTRVSDESLTSIHEAFKAWEAPAFAPSEDAGQSSVLPQRPNISMPTEIPFGGEFDPNPVPTPSPEGETVDPDEGVNEGSSGSAEESPEGSNSAEMEEESGSVEEGSEGEEGSGSSEESGQGEEEGEGN